jgi:DNA-binding LacI/PurR family transcriptional regulator
VRSGSRPTIVDVARTAGVSPTTVSYVLSGSRARAERISEATRERVLAAVEEIGYVPNESARALRLRRSSRVVFLGGRFTSLYSQSIAQAIEPALAAHGLNLDIRVGSDIGQIERAIATLDQKLADGLIVETEGQGTALLHDAAGRGQAIVAIGPNQPDPAFDVISHDISSALHQATDHLAHREFHHIVLMSLRESSPWEHRIAVARDQLVARGVPEATISIVHSPHNRIRAHDAALEFLSRLDLPVAVYAGSDVSAIGVLWAAARLGLRVPGDVRIVGHGDTPEIDITVPRLTSLGPINRDFATVADLIASRLRDPSLPGRHIVEPWKFSIREST